MDFLELAKKRYSVREYDSRPVEMCIRDRLYTVLIRELIPVWKNVESPRTVTTLLVSPCA